MEVLVFCFKNFFGQCLEVKMLLSKIIHHQAWIHWIRFQFDPKVFAKDNYRKNISKKAYFITKHKGNLRLSIESNACNFKYLTENIIVVSTFLARGKSVSKVELHTVRSFRPLQFKTPIISAYPLPNTPIC